MPRYAFLLALTLFGAAAAAILVLHRGGSGDDGAAAVAAVGSESGQPRPPRLFGAASVWNRSLPPDAPLDPSSTRAVAGLDREVGRELRNGVGPWIDASSCSTPLYVVPAGQPSVRVRLTDPGAPWRAGLARAFRRVPLPAGAEPAECSDAQLTVWQPASDRLWEFFHLRREAGEWRADWGGAMRGVSRSSGYYDSRSLPGLSNWTWGATATSLPVAAGVMRLAELRRGEIGHALAMNVPVARRGEFSWPAQRSDGDGPATAIPEGARFRLDPGLDLGGLDLPPLTLAMAEAAQRYGIVVRDQTGAGNGIAFFGEDPKPSAGRPYARAGGFYGELSPSQLLADFPWRHLQLLRLRLCRTGPCRR